MNAPDVGPLPPGAILLHVGPYKTGSTTIQTALFEQRAALAECGVHYPDRWRRLFREGHALMRWAPRGKSVPPESVWDDFAGDLRDRRDVRICLSTEDFGRIRNPDRVRKIVVDLGADRLHVLAVARAFHRLLPSHWQERVKSHEQLSYDEWLHQLFEGDRSQNAHRAFWTSHDIERMTALWSGLLPADHFTVIATDDSDRLLLSRTFEQLLGLPAGLLTATDSANASLSMNAVEVLRRVNALFAERGWSDHDYRALVRGGIVRGLQEAGRSAYDMAMPPLPAWVRPLVADRTRQRIEAIRSSGVNVVGDLDVLVPPDQPLPDPTHLAPDTVSVDAAAAAIVGALDAALRQPATRRRAGPGSRPDSPAPALPDVRGGVLVRELARRMRARLPVGR